MGTLDTFDERAYDPQHVQFSYAGQVTTPFRRFVIGTVERLTARSKLEQLYGQNRMHPVAGESFWSAAVRLLELDIRFDAAALANAPAQGPLVVVANHPYGVLDGVTLCWLVERLRSDFRLLASSVLTQAPELQPWLLPVDLSTRESARDMNVATRRKALDHVREGGALIVFPAGLISVSPDRAGRRRAIDPPWGTFAAQIARRTDATVLPVYFHGQNSRLFQIASHIDRTLKLALIFREVGARIGSSVTASIGAPVPFEHLANGRGDRALTDDLRERTYSLREDGAKKSACT
ncbi:acyltransferase [Paraburkholderia sp. Tr-20389]|uniref:lysophospholipid acyltransferase family protein n=1 Tax=Paraburkholderia sp. Tr-20389 TaxID=2703903 RepID=UPI00197DE359|nr:lysophospholipid acyltransferase family protein [Paraburkholderia sp. Tr-20389]MBN3751627.1 acyltransferase [Paraburkholderia sp. Tr-20389]